MNSPDADPVNDAPPERHGGSRISAGRVRLLTGWLALVYGSWIAGVSLGDHWGVVRDHWQMALAMAIGSYFAGSTPMGGGTIGFPVLTLILDQPPDLGRDFSFAIQSVGMVSASVFIVCLAHPVAWRILRWALIGTTVGTPLGIIFLSHRISSLGIQIFFAVLWAGFGLLHIWKLNEFSDYKNIHPTTRSREMAAGLMTGLLAGAFIASILGVGIDLALYAVLVLVFRCDLRIAIPSSVILMAWTSVVGVLTRTLSGSLNPEVFGHWLAAAPVVAIGAPLGAIIVKKIGRKPTLWLVSFLCLLQLGWTLSREFDSLRLQGTAAALIAVAVCFGLFSALYHLGSRLRH